jgi:hypothetical protein
VKVIVGANVVDGPRALVDPGIVVVVVDGEACEPEQDAAKSATRTSGRRVDGIAPT